MIQRLLRFLVVLSLGSVDGIARKSNIVRKLPAISVRRKVSQQRVVVLANEVPDRIDSDEVLIVASSDYLSTYSWERTRFSVLSILLPWLYFMSISLNIPSLPKFVNAVINKGNTDVSEESARVYGNVAGIDSLFTFLSVNLVGCLSDGFGRRPFMLMSSLGTNLWSIENECRP